jgi:O-antigen/teichoic acid export membrane protein
MKGSVAVGLYRAGYRYLDILSGLIGANLGAASLPAFSRVSAESSQALARLTVLTVRVMILVSLPIALWGTFYGPQILALNGRDFGPASGLALRILIWAFPLFLIETPLYQALYALHRQRDVTTFFLVTLVFNVGANLLLIPHYSFLGSAVITVASEVLNVSLTLVAVRRRLPSLHYRAVGLRPFLPTLVLGVVLVVLTAVWGASMWVGIPIGAAVYLLTLRVLHVLGPQEYEIIARLPLGRRVARLVGAAPS